MTLIALSFDALRELRGAGRSKDTSGKRASAGALHGKCSSEHSTSCSAKWPAVLNVHPLAAALR